VGSIVKSCEVAVCTAAMAVMAVSRFDDATNVECKCSRDLLCNSVFTFSQCVCGLYSFVYTIS